MFHPFKTQASGYSLPTSNHGAQESNKLSDNQYISNSPIQRTSHCIYDTPINLNTPHPNLGDFNLRDRDSDNLNLADLDYSPEINDILNGCIPSDLTTLPLSQIQSSEDTSDMTAPFSRAQIRPPTARSRYLRSSTFSTSSSSNSTHDIDHADNRFKAIKEDDFPPINNPDLRFLSKIRRSLSTNSLPPEHQTHLPPLWNCVVPHNSSPPRQSSNSTSPTPLILENIPTLRHNLRSYQTDTINAALQATPKTLIEIKEYAKKALKQSYRKIPSKEKIESFVTNQQNIKYYEYKNKTYYYLLENKKEAIKYYLLKQEGNGDSTNLATLFNISKEDLSNRLENDNEIEHFNHFIPKNNINRYLFKTCKVKKKIRHEDLQKAVDHALRNLIHKGLMHHWDEKFVTAPLEDKRGVSLHQITEEISELDYKIDSHSISAYLWTKSRNQQLVCKHFAGATRPCCYYLPEEGQNEIIGNSTPNAAITTSTTSSSGNYYSLGSPSAPSSTNTASAASSSVFANASAAE